jgi:uncharacterized protein YeaO (DUF488 family)
MGEIEIQRVREYVEQPAVAKGTTVFLVDRIWPRGIPKADLDVTWTKEVAPSTELRKWFGHDPAKWDEFRKRYLAELKENGGAADAILTAAREGAVLLLFDAKDTEHNQAVVLAEWLRSR